MGSNRPSPPGLAWRWSDALFGAVCAAPSAVVVFHDVSRGVACAVGVLPAVIVGVIATRRRRLGVIVVGATTGASIVLGSALAGWPWLAVTGIFLLALLTAELAQTSGRASRAGTRTAARRGRTELRRRGTKRVGLAVIMTVGAVYAWAVSLIWPERRAPLPTAEGATPGHGYGLRLGLAGGTAAALGFVLELDHLGWPCAAALLVMRPSSEMTQLRSLGRVASVIVGAATTVAFVEQAPRAVGYALAVVVVVTGAAATRTSRWYVTSAFTTFLVIVLLGQSDAGAAVQGFDQRVSETVLGVGLAYLFGMVVPTIAQQRRLQVL